MPSPRHSSSSASRSVGRYLTSALGRITCRYSNVSSGGRAPVEDATGKTSGRGERQQGGSGGFGKRGRREARCQHLVSGRAGAGKPLHASPAARVVRSAERVGTIAKRQLSQPSTDSRIPAALQHQATYRTTVAIARAPLCDDVPDDRLALFGRALGGGLGDSSGRASNALHASAVEPSSPSQL